MRGKVLPIHNYKMGGMANQTTGAVRFAMRLMARGLTIK